jgi:DNA-binding NtrC family response regulator
MDKKTGKILIVDDDEDILQAARLLLKKHVALVATEKNQKSIPSLMKNEAFDVILLDMNFAKGATSGKEGFSWLNKILEIDPYVVVVLITAFGDVEMAVRAIKEGASDFVLKPWQNEKLIATVSTAIRLRQSRVEADNLRSRQKQLSADLDQPFHDFIGHSPVMAKVFATIQKLAKTDANVLILGENGIGKELVARELHRQSQRADEVFISVDMGAVSETLFESELFGHAKGAFTDAREERAGRFEIASGGTLFLDEICNLPLTLQAKLLTVLDSRNVIRLGTNKHISIDVRLICATNMPVHEMVAENKFRQDLLYRITTDFLKIYCNKYNKPLKRMSPATMKRVEKYAWPGNVRELQHAIERAVIMSDSTTFQPSDFFFPSTGTKEDSLFLEDYNLEEMEKMVIRKALSKHGGNISLAAKELGLSRTSLYRRFEKYGL